VITLKLSGELNGFNVLHRQVEAEFAKFRINVACHLGDNQLKPTHI
jgi:hypothetical protein